MKKFYALILMLNVALVSFAQVQVTFNLDMTATDYDEETEDLYFSGGPNGWATPGTDANAKFTDNGDGTFTLVLAAVDSGYYWTDFYRENDGGSGWGTNGEWPGIPMKMDCMLYADDDDVVMNVTWKTGYNDLTLNVDMNNETGFDAATGKVYFFDNDYTKLNGTELTDLDEDGIYTLDVDSIPQAFVSATFAYSRQTENDTVYEWDITAEQGLMATRMIQMQDDNIDNIYVFGNPDIKVAIDNKTAKEVEISVYPNPSNGIFRVDLDGIYDVTVIDVTGKTVYSDIIENKGTINMADLAPGIYLARFKSGSKISISKLLLQ